ncbi:hypothetical protein MtrunA17_Chr4g0043011 [Medicago truncatula]|uniref:Uncharacterized protein n=1 Tax=Medicago truncatula TaxID=3880 RepID=A0A396IB83_MEDTR|nr:hypothetical protein MtrunA17_Chr4g0043011 [Medicago truncatula]
MFLTDRIREVTLHIYRDAHVFFRKRMQVFFFFFLRRGTQFF